MKKVIIASCHRLLHNNTIQEDDDDDHVSSFFSQASFQVKKEKEGDGSKLPLLFSQQILCSKTIEEGCNSCRHLLLWWCCYEEDNDNNVLLSSSQEGDGSKLLSPSL
jgi:hypothetical protein